MELGARRSDTVRHPLHALHHTRSIVVRRVWPTEDAPFPQSASDALNTGQTTTAPIAAAASETALNSPLVFNREWGSRIRPCSLPVTQKWGQVGPETKGRAECDDAVAQGGQGCTTPDQLRHAAPSLAAALGTKGRMMVPRTCPSRVALACAGPGRLAVSCPRWH